MLNDSQTICSTINFFKPQNNELHFQLDQSKKTNKCADHVQMFHVDVNMKQFGIRFKVHVNRKFATAFTSVLWRILPRETEYWMRKIEGVACFSSANWLDEVK